MKRPRFESYFVLFFIIFCIGIISCNTTTKNNDGSVTQDSAATSNHSTIPREKFVSDSFIVSRVGVDNSPYTSVQRMIGVDMVTIKYNSINFPESNINIEKEYGNIWMISDYHPMVLNTTSDLYVCNTGIHEGTKHHLMNLNNANDHSLIKAGNYALYASPGKNGDWTLYFNSRVSSDTGTKLLYNYDSTKNIAAIKIKPEKSDRFEDQLFVRFEKTGMDSSIVSIYFGNTRLSFKLLFNNSEKLYSRDTGYLASARQGGQHIEWDEYMEAAEDCSNKAGTHLDSALAWINDAIKLHAGQEKQNTQNDIHTVTLLKVEADVLAEMHRFSDAAGCLNNAINELKASPKPNLEAIAQFQKQVENLQKFTK